MKAPTLLLVFLLSVSLLGMQAEPFSFKVVATGLLNPWEITWGPDDNLWVTERTGKRVTRVNPADGSKSTAATIDEVFTNHGQDGLLGMALHPGLLRGAGTDYVYVAYTYDTDPGPNLNRRGKIRRSAGRDCAGGSSGRRGFFICPCCRISCG